jgi:hypothetical protein
VQIWEQCGNLCDVCQKRRSLLHRDFALLGHEPKAALIEGHSPRVTGVDQVLEEWAGPHLMALWWNEFGYYNIIQCACNMLWQCQTRF